MINLKGVKNIIFDLGGVLLNLDFQLTQQAFVDLGVVDFDSYYTKAKQNGVFDSFETGKITETEFCEELRMMAGIKVPDIEIVNSWNAMLLDFPIKRKELLLNLKNEFKTSLLSNTNETHVRAFNQIIQKDIQEEELAPLFDSHYYSNEVGLRKPDTTVFEYVLEQNNYKADETLFLDDSAQHIEGAKMLGIRTFHIEAIPVEVLFANFLA